MVEKRLLRIFVSEPVRWGRKTVASAIVASLHAHGFQHIDMFKAQNGRKFRHRNERNQGSRKWRARRNDARNAVIEVWGPDEAHLRGAWAEIVLRVRGSDARVSAVQLGTRAETEATRVPQ